MILMIKVVPNSSKNCIDSFQDGILKVRIQAQPEKGKANEELIRFLSKTFGIPKTAIKILSGETGRLKRIDFSEEIDLIPFKKGDE